MTTSLLLTDNKGLPPPTSFTTPVVFVEAVCDKIGYELVSVGFCIAVINAFSKSLVDAVVVGFVSAVFDNALAPEVNPALANAPPTKLTGFIGALFKKEFVKLLATLCPADTIDGSCPANA